MTSSRAAWRAEAAAPASARPSLALLVAVGIGVHNLGEGLAIGTSFAFGELTLGTFLIVGFMIHNVTEGLGIAAPAAESRTHLSVGRLALLALIAGGPAVLGAWIGGFASSDLLAVLFFAAAAGAALEVVDGSRPLRREPRRRRPALRLGPRRLPRRDRRHVRDRAARRLARRGGDERLVDRDERLLAELDTRGRGVLLDLLGPARARRSPTRGSARAAPRRARAAPSSARARPRSAAGAARPPAPRRRRRRSIAQPISLDAAREPAGGSSPGLYFPVNAPWPSGDQTICEIPFSRQTSKTSRSGARHRSEYCGWLDTNFSTPGSASELRISLDRPLAEPDVARLSLAHDLGQRLHRLLERRVVVEAVALVEVDVLRPEPAEREIDLLEDLLAREPAVVVVHGEEDLRREDVRVAGT